MPECQYIIDYNIVGRFPREFTATNNGGTYNVHVAERAIQFGGVFNSLVLPNMGMRCGLWRPAGIVMTSAGNF